MNLLVSNHLLIVNDFPHVLNVRSGIYTEPNCGTNILGRHAITVVGYGSLNGVQYWVYINVDILHFRI